MPSDYIEFTGSQGFTLSGRLDIPKKSEPQGFALFAHCFTCSKNLTAAGNITHALTTRGIAVLRFDFTGLGESEGDFADTNFSSNTADLIAAAQYLENTHSAPALLIGHSLGGAAVLQAAARIPSSQAVVTIGAPYEPLHVKRLLLDAEDEIRTRGEAHIRLSGRNFKIKKQFLDDLEQHNMKTTIRELSRALLVFHSPVDDIVGIDNAASIFTAAKHPKSFISLDDADHLLTRTQDSLYTGALAASWAKRYL